MYGKIFQSMYDGTIAVNWKGLVTFQQMIVLCESDGVIDITPPALSKRTGIPLDIIEDGIEYLSQPDPYSRSQEHEGRRIILLDEHRPWGWVIVNHEYYRDLASVEDRREKAKLRKQKQREKEGEKEDVTPCHTLSRMSRHTDTNTNTNTKKKTKRFTPPSLQEIIDYCKERKNSVNPNDFLNHYQANGWYRGKTKVKDWKACVRTWEKNRPDSNFEKGAI